jgi:hypothetical protein
MRLVHNRFCLYKATNVGNVWGESRAKKGAEGMNGSQGGSSICCFRTRNLLDPYSGHDIEPDGLRRCVWDSTYLYRKGRTRGRGGFSKGDCKPIYAVW